MKNKINELREDPVFFISHSTNDSDAVGLFVKEILRNGLEFKVADIFVTSIEGHKISSGDDFVNAIEHGLKKCKIAFLFLSENYKASEICLNEMGASWVLNDCHPIPIIYGDLPYDKVGALQITKQIERLKDDEALDNIAQTLIKLKVVKKLNPPLWSAAKKSFLKQLANVKIKDPPYKKLSIEEYQKLLSTISESEEALVKIMSEKSQMETLIEKLQEEPVVSKRKEIVSKTKKGKVNYQEIFDEKIDTVDSYASKLENINNLLILSNYYDLPQPSINGWKEEVDSAVRKGYLDAQNDLCTLEKKKFIKDFHEALYEIGKLKSNADFCNWYEDKYEDEFDPASESFWETHYNL